MAKIKAVWKKINDYVPICTFVCLLLAVASVIVWGCLKKDSAFAEALNSTTGRAVRWMMAMPANIIPFSFVEMVILISPVLLALLIVLIVKKAKKGAKQLVRLLCVFLSMLCIVFTAFTFGYEPSYYGKTVDENIGVVRSDLSAEELKAAATIMLTRAQEEIENVSFTGSGSSVMPYTFSELSKQLNRDTEKFCSKYPMYQSMYTVCKPVLLSEPMTYTHLSGVYSFFTGESNINVNYPDFIVVTTTAHEMMHQRGIGKEDECDFAAFLICIGSDDSYIRYCGYIELYRQVVSDLYSADHDAYYEVRKLEDPRLRADIDAFSTFFEKYRENKVAEVTNVVNDAYTTAQNQPAGVQSYGLVVDLAVGYILNEK